MTGFLAVIRREIGLHQIPSHFRADRAAAHTEDIHMIILHPLLG